MVHAHCHHRATFGVAAQQSILEKIGAKITLLDSGCCGMAGPFGFEREKYDISQTLANRVLLPAVRKAGPETIILTDGFSCAQQITQNTAAKPLHLAELLVGE
jgi:Fe-S oxidoreductase